MKAPWHIDHRALSSNPLPLPPHPTKPTPRLTLPPSPLPNPLQHPPSPLNPLIIHAPHPNPPIKRHPCIPRRIHQVPLQKIQIRKGIVELGLMRREVLPLGKLEPVPRDGDGVLVEPLATGLRDGLLQLDHPLAADLGLFDFLRAGQGRVAERAGALEAPVFEEVVPAVGVVGC